MIAQKLLTKQNESQSEEKLPNIKVEDFLENITEWMFKIIIFIGIPYFLIILFQFLRMY